MEELHRYLVEPQVRKEPPKHISAKPKDLRIDYENLSVNLMVASTDAEERETAQDVLNWIKEIEPLGRKTTHFTPMLSQNS